MGKIKIITACSLLLSLKLQAASGELIKAEIDWFQEVIRGGMTSLALVLLLIAGITFAVERMLALREKYIVPKDLAVKVEPLWHQGNFTEILKICEQTPCTLSRMIEYLSHHRMADPGLLIPGAQDIAGRELKTHGQKAFSLAVVAALAPLLGLLGTSMLAGSISKALITTAVGLIIAIPGLGLYHWFKYRINYFSETLEEQLEFLVNSWLLRGGAGISSASNPVKPSVKPQVISKASPLSDQNIPWSDSGNAVKEKASSSINSTLSGSKPRVVEEKKSALEKNAVQPKTISVKPSLKPSRDA